MTTLPRSNRCIGPRRRSLLVAGTGWWLAACGGADGGDEGATGGGGPSASGRLVFSNRSQACVWDFAAGSGGVFDLGDVPSLGQGLSVSAAGTLALAREIDNDWIGLDVVDLAGLTLQRLRIARAFAFYTSPITFNAAGTRIAFSLDELPDGAADRIERTVVFSWPDGRLLATLDGCESPEWVAATGELVVRDVDSQALRLFDADLRDQGPLAGLVVNTQLGSYSISPDGRHVLMEDGPRIRVHDRTDGSHWVAAERISNLHAPTLSPDGRWLAFHAIHLPSASPQFHTYVPHVVPFVRGQTVRVSEDTPTLGLLAFTGYSMDWIA